MTIAISPRKMVCALLLLLLQLAARFEIGTAFSSSSCRTKAATLGHSSSGSSSTVLFAAKGGGDGGSSLTLYGSQGSRSPLVNWAANELELDITMGDLSKNPHPFGQIPCLEHKLINDNNSKPKVVFESGAILLYLNALSSSSQCTTTPTANEEDQTNEIYSWVCWANASLDPICFLETPNGKVYDTGLKDTNNPKIRKFDELLQDRAFLVNGDELTVADVAVASYLLYVVQFFPDVDLSTWPNMVQYMKRCASREAYGKAFGAPVQAFLLDKLDKMGSDTKNAKLFGMF